MARGRITITALIVDPFGVICGAMPRRPAPPQGQDAPTGARMEPGAGRRVVEVALDAKASELGFDDLRAGYRVALRGKPRLVRVRPPAVSATPATEAPAKTKAPRASKQAARTRK
jgi:hypothetical protein